MPFEIVLPVCVITLIGFIASRLSIVGKTAPDVIGDLVFKLIIPILLFRMVARADFSTINFIGIWGSYFAAIAVIWVLAGLIFPLLFKRETKWGLIASISSTFANTVLVGIPIITLAFGDDGLAPLTILLSIHLTTMLFVSIIHSEIITFFERSSVEKGPLFSSLNMLSSIGKSMLINPIVIGILLGFIYNFSGLDWFVSVDSVLEPIATSGGPLALLVLGMGLDKYGIVGDFKPAMFVTLLKLILMPMLIFVFGHYVFNLPPMHTATLVVVGACPSGVNSYIFANFFETGQKLAANSITLTMIASTITLTIWLALMQVYLSG